MKIRTGKCYLFTGFYALLMMHLLDSGYADYQNYHNNDIQMKNYEHPRFGDSWIRYCAFNQYLDDEEGRCMIVPGGGIAISIDDDTTCDPESLREDPSRPKNYYICRKTKTIIAECGSGKRFENRLKRCTIDKRWSDAEQEDSDTEARSYEHMDVPACEKPGRYPVPQEDCSIFYACTSNGFRLFRTFHKCPSSTGFDPLKQMCRSERACSKSSDEVASTRVANETTMSFIVTTVSSVSKSLSNDTKKNAWLQETTDKVASASTTEFYKITTEEMRTSTAKPSTGIRDSSVVSRTTTESYEHGEATMPSASTKYVHLSDRPEEGKTLEDTTNAETTVGMKVSSTERMILLRDKVTTSFPVSTERVYYNTVPDDYVMFRNNYPRYESSTEPAVTMVSNRDDTSISIRELEIAMTKEATTFRIELQNSETTESTKGIVTEEWLSDTIIADSSTRIVEMEATAKSWTNEATGTTREVTGLRIEPQNFETTESTRQNVTEDWFSDTDSSTITVEELPQKITTERRANAATETMRGTTFGIEPLESETTESARLNVTEEWFSDAIAEDSSTTTFEELPQESTTERWREEAVETTKEATTFGIESEDFETTESATQNVTKEWFSDTTVTDSSTIIFDDLAQETTNETAETTEVANFFDSGTTESSKRNITEEWFYKTPIDDSSTTILDETSQAATTERVFDNPTSDRYTEASEITASLIDYSPTVPEKSWTFSSEEKNTFSNDATSTTPINLYTPTEEESWESLFTHNIDSSNDPIGVFESTTDSFTSETPQNEETTIFESWSTKAPDNSISTDRTESTMITTESTYISQSTEETPKYSETTLKDNSPTDLFTSASLMDQMTTDGKTAFDTSTTSIPQASSISDDETDISKVTTFINTNFNSDEQTKSSNIASTTLNTSEEQTTIGISDSTDWLSFSGQFSSSSADSTTEETSTRKYNNKDL